MKRIILLMLVVMGFTATQATATPVKRKKDKLTAEQRAEKITARLDSIVSLTNGQRKDVYQLALTKVRKTDEIKTKYKGNKEAEDQKKAEVKAVKKEFRGELKKILTKDQLATLKAYRQEHKKTGDKHRRDNTKAPAK